MANQSLEQRDAYFLAFGKFMHSFSLCEGRTLAFLVWKSGIDEEISRALLSGVRIEAASSMIRRVYETQRETVPPIVDSALSQISVINSVRNDLVHYGATFEDEVPKVSTARAANIPEKARVFQISPSLLRDMTIDVGVAGALLVAHRFSSTLTASGYGLIDPVNGPTSWRYIPPQQASSRQKTRDKKPKQQRPLKPSQQSPDSQK